MDFPFRKTAATGLKDTRMPERLILKNPSCLRIFRKTHKNAVDDKSVEGSYRQFAPVLYRMILRVITDKIERLTGYARPI